MSSNHQIFAVDKQAKDIYSELKKCFLRRILRSHLSRVTYDKIWTMDRYTIMTIEKKANQYSLNDHLTAQL